MKRWSKHLLDTDTLTRLFYKHPKVTTHFKTAIDAQQEVGTTVISKIEMLRGCDDFLLKAATGTKIIRAQQLLTQTEAFLAKLDIVPFDEAAAAQFDILRENKKLRKIGRADLLIASITLAHKAILVSRNLRHFQQVPNLKVINWVD
jgi:tRNA(fMet)-specific endonuclease VapC